MLSRVWSTEYRMFSEQQIFPSSKSSSSHNERASELSVFWDLAEVFAMFSSDSGIGGFHNDVLNAFPTDDDSALKLVEEIKNRAKGCISSQNYPGAISLYSKAIEICPSESMASKAILYSNRSLCHFSMSSSDLAIEDAGHSIVADPTYLKVPSHLIDLLTLFGLQKLDGQTILRMRYRLYRKEQSRPDVAISSLL